MLNPTSLLRNDRFSYCFCTFSSSFRSHLVRKEKCYTKFQVQPHNKRKLRNQTEKSEHSEIVSQKYIQKSDTRSWHIAELKYNIKHRLKYSLQSLKLIQLKKDPTKNVERQSKTFILTLVALSFLAVGLKGQAGGALTGFLYSHPSHAYTLA